MKQELRKTYDSRTSHDSNSIKTWKTLIQMLQHTKWNSVSQNCILKSLAIKRPKITCRLHLSRYDIQHFEHYTICCIYIMFNVKGSTCNITNHLWCTLVLHHWCGIIFVAHPHVVQSHQLCNTRESRIVIWSIHTKCSPFPCHIFIHVIRNKNS
jgi:hypothetical protein